MNILLVAVVLWLKTPGFSQGLMCYNCTNIKSASAAELSVQNLIKTPGCSNIDGNTPVPAINCSLETDVCVYLQAEAIKEQKDGLTEEILGSETYEIEVRDCISVTDPKPGCYEGVVDQEAIALIQNVLDTDRFESGRTCFCANNLCDAKLCDGLKIGGSCFSYWLAAVFVGATIGLFFILLCCCSIGCKKKEEVVMVMKNYRPKGHLGGKSKKYSSQVDEKTKEDLDFDKGQESSTSNQTPGETANEPQDELEGEPQEEIEGEPQDETDEAKEEEW